MAGAGGVLGGDVAEHLEDAPLRVVAVVVGPKAQLDPALPQQAFEYEFGVVSTELLTTSPSTKTPYCKCKSGEMEGEERDLPRSNLQARSHLLPLLSGN